ncbi:hypothetical protein SCHPADRAFT_941002 [Schizopora paradoxa]|uniref:DUF6533 domain-containing protein n=1 Tax=Schizopora paradoxa TaxID=27342 RepID=A0A0H2S799_9AGAM|nr:hypothetical protein SCHPADRAFT_941002 [Schizopora paradoxa]
MLDILEVVQEATIVKGVHDVNGQPSVVITYTLLIYDIIQNLEDEVTYVWSHKGYIGNALYFATRYLALIDMTVLSTYFFKPSLSANTCKTLHITYAYFIVFVTVIAEIILILRTWAIWHKSKVILRYLIAYSKVLIIGGVANVQLSLNGYHYQTSPLPRFLPCYAVAAGFRVYIDYAIVLVMDLNVLILTALRAFSQRQREPPNTYILSGWLLVPTLSLCMFDRERGTIGSIAGTLFKTLYYFLFLEPERVIHSVFSAHLIRNVRKVVDADPEYSTSSALATSRLGGLEFAVNCQASTTPESTTTQILSEVQA